jgi:hypothetical protein
VSFSLISSVSLPKLFSSYANNSCPLYKFIASKPSNRKRSARYKRSSLAYSTSYSYGLLCTSSRLLKKLASFKYSLNSGFVLSLSIRCLTEPELSNSWFFKRSSVLRIKSSIYRLSPSNSRARL